MSGFPVGVGALVDVGGGGGGGEVQEYLSELVGC